jgi:hypothetical protein
VGQLRAHKRVARGRVLEGQGKTNYRLYSNSFFSKKRNLEILGSPKNEEGPFHHGSVLLVGTSNSEVSLVCQSAPCPEKISTGMGLPLSGETKPKSQQQ